MAAGAGAAIALELFRLGVTMLVARSERRKQEVSARLAEISGQIRAIRFDGPTKGEDDDHPHP